jgi:hypothetical protein
LKLSAAQKRTDEKQWGRFNGASRARKKVLDDPVKGVPVRIRALNFILRKLELK